MPVRRTQNGLCKFRREEMKLSGAVKESASFVAVGTAIGTAVMLAAFLVLHMLTSSVPFGFGVIAGAVLGCLVAVGNFFIMALIAEKAAADDNFDDAKRKMTLSYRYRTLGQIVFIILAIVIPQINAAAAVIPLVIPGALIRGKGVWDYKRK